MPDNQDRATLRDLAERIAEIAALPIQEEKRRLWRALNDLRPQRPMVTIDQVCWSEIRDDTLRLRCEDPECRAYEQSFRRTLYQWEHFPVDMVVEPYVEVDMAVENTSFGMSVKEHTLAVCEENEVLSHHYENQIAGMEDVEKIKTPIVTHDTAETARRVQFAEWIFGDIMEVRAVGLTPSLSIWDRISGWMSVEGVLYAIIDQPEMMHALAKRLSDGFMTMLDQMEELGVLRHSQTLIHCTGAYTDDLPSAGFDKAKPKTRDMWMFGLAQMFSTVSPAMFDEYEITYSMPLFERFGLVYYGCCDPLDGKMNEVKKIPHLRKISVSPWANQTRCAQEIGPHYVFSRKPNPALLAMGTFDADLIECDLAETLDICQRNGCPAELILKDLSTVRGQPDRLDRWADIAMKIIQRYGM